MGSSTRLAPYYDKRLSGVLGDARRASGISQQRLADRAGVSIGSIAKLEAGRSVEPGFFLVARVVSALTEALPPTKRTAFQHAVRAYFD